MLGRVLLVALCALVATALGSPRLLTRDDGVPGGDLGYIECKKATEDRWHLPYPGDCTKFIKCHISGNLSTIYTCDSPLHFDTKIQTCNWPNQAGCDSNEGDGSSTSSSTQGTTDGGGGGGGGGGGDYDKYCSNATPEVWHLPYPGDCSKFVKCDYIGGLYTIYTCDSPLHFNPSIQTCDWPQNAGCQEGTSSSSTSSTSSSTTTTTTAPTSTTASSTTSQTTPSPTSTTTPSGCETTTEKKESCEDRSSSSSSSSSESCECNCHEKPKPTPTCPQPTPAPSPPPSPSPSPTPAPTNAPGGNNCPAPFGPGDVCRVAYLPDYWHIADPTNNARFYKCEIQSCRAFLFDCPSGLVFNQAIQVCDWP